MARKKINQSDLRKLMKERSERLVKKDVEKVESPLAKYDNLGRLFCIACNEQISKIPWRVHIISKNHKENVSKRLKRKLNENESANQPPPFQTSVQQNTVKLKDVSLNGQISTVDAKKSTKDVVSKPATSLIQSYSSSDEEDDEDDKTPLTVVPAATSSALPSDFFDSPSSAPPLIPKTEVPNTVSKVTPAASSSNTLPEGFFDDPILDAKARHVEYKDPREEEWEKFQKTIAEETTVSQSIIEEDAEESAVNKNIDQIDEQIHKWQKVNELLSKRENIIETLHTKTVEKQQDISDNSSEENEDLECLLDWRAKDLWEK